MSLGERLLLLLRKNRLSQEKLADLAGCSQAAINKLVNNISLKSKYITEICRALGCSTDWLEKGIEEEFPIKLDTLAKRVKYIRKKLGYSQTDIAEKVGLTQIGFHNIEQGQSLRPRNINKLAEVLKVTPEWLLFGGENLSIISKIGNPTLLKLLEKLDSIEMELNQIRRFLIEEK